jgi:hypothetical protein
MFLRGVGGNAAPLGQQQNDAIRDIKGQFWGDSRRNQGGDIRHQVSLLTMRGKMAVLMGSWRRWTLQIQL